MANKRKRRLLLSVLATLLGTVALAGLGVLRMVREDTDLGDPSAGVSAEFQHSEVEGAPSLSFREVAAELGIDFRHGPGERGRTLPEDTGSGLAWGDFDGDGDDDLYLVNFAGALGDEPDPDGGNRLFRNDGGTFRDVTDRAGVEDLLGFGMGASFADYDRDGDLDLFVANYGPDRLFRNRGDGRFEEVAEELGVAGEGWSIAGAWGDFDRDGLLDLYVTRYVIYDPRTPEIVEADVHWQAVPFTLNPNSFDPLPNRLFRQTTAGVFEDVGLTMGADDPRGRSLSASFVDVDADGWLDLYVANDVSPNALFHNRAGEVGFAIFEDWSAVTGTADERGSMGISVADLAGGAEAADGLPDLFISHWVAQENALYISTTGPAGRLEYRDRIRNVRLGEVSTERVGWGTAFADLDLDGRVDLLVANGSTLEDENQRLQEQAPFVFWNGGDRFYDLTGQVGEELARPKVARGLAVSDFDRDGDPDFALSINRRPAQLLQNQQEVGGNWLAVRAGAPGAQFFGSRLQLTRADSTETRFLGADVSFASCHSQEVLFGLGNESEARLTLLNLDGSSWTIEGVAPGRRLQLVP